MTNFYVKVLYNMKKPSLCIKRPKKKCKNTKRYCKYASGSKRKFCYRNWRKTLKRKA